jgi:hypothetical protein
MGIDVIKAGYDLKRIVETMRAATVNPEIINSMEGELKRKIDQQIDEKVAALLDAYRGEAGRRNELEKPVHMALEQLLQRLERGMVIEIRAIPPPTTVGNEPDGRQEKFSQVQAIAKTLEFPKISGDHMLQLTSDDQTTKSSR